MRSSDGSSDVCSSDLWNAMAMVGKANSHTPPDGGDLGGHIASFASLATMIGCGQNHFWQAETEDHGGDLVYFQGHSSPGIYGRAYLEGRLTEDQLNNFRQEEIGRASCRERVCQYV